MLGNSPFWLYARQFLSNNFLKKKKGNPKERYDFSFLFYSSLLKEGNSSSLIK